MLASLLVLVLLLIVAPGCSKTHTGSRDFAAYVDSATSRDGRPRRLVSMDSMPSQAYPGTTIYVAELEPVPTMPHAYRWLTAWRATPERILRLGPWTSPTQWLAWSASGASTFRAVEGCHELSSTFLIGYPNRVKLVHGLAEIDDLQVVPDSAAARRILGAQRYALMDSSLDGGATRLAAFTAWTDESLFRVSCVFQQGQPPQVGATLLADFLGTSVSSRLLRGLPGTPSF